MKLKTWDHRWPLLLGALSMLVLLFLGLNLTKDTDLNRPLADHSELSAARERIVTALGDQNLIGLNKASIASRLAQRDLQSQLGLYYEALEQRNFAEARQILSAMKEKFPQQPLLMIDWSLFHLLAVGEVEKAASGFINLLFSQKLSEDKGQDNELDLQLLSSIIDIYQRARQWQAGIFFIEQLSQHAAKLPAMAQLALSRFHYELQEYEAAQQGLEGLKQKKLPLSLLGQALALETQIKMALGHTELAIQSFYQAEKTLDQAIKENMRRGMDFYPLVEAMEEVQFFMAKHLIKAEAFPVAETILLKLAEKFPSHPEVVKLLDTVRLQKFELGAG